MGPKALGARLIYQVAYGRRNFKYDACNSVFSDVILQAENYKLLIDQTEERLKQTELDKVSQRDNFRQKEEELLAKMQELEDKYVVQLQEKANLLLESNSRENSLCEELEALKQEVSQGDGQLQTLQKREEELKVLLQKELETSSALKLELQKVQEETMTERSLSGRRARGGTG
ncbi:outer spore wall assembly protein SHE10-like [Bufo gargarizans]|uniref:outer spore wall assembly protein SHE10-like n=1 Tax=Bufo gargarizans TaxID=30331 RepID=UPI001CF57BFF|nr:outer spore wall assembly protein SHE10-like [Bufo gargarizans]